MEKKYFVGVKVTPAYLTEKLEIEELLPDQYNVQVCRSLESLNHEIGFLERQNIYCGAIVTIDELYFPLQSEYVKATKQFELKDCFVLLVEKTGDDLRDSIKNIGKPAS